MHKKHQYNKQLIRNRNSHSHDSSILSNSLNRKKNRSKAKMYQSPKSISSSRYSNSEINESSSLVRDEFSTIGSEKDSLNMVNINQQQIQPKKSKIVQTNSNVMKSRLINDYNYENIEKYEISAKKSYQKVSNEKLKNRTRLSFQPMTCNQLKQSTQINSNNKLNMIKLNKKSSDNLVINNEEEYNSYPVINPNTKIEKHDIIPVNIKKNYNENCKIASIKHFSKSSSNYENDNLYINLKTMSSSCLRRVESSSINYLNVNDLYAILKPVIKPHVYINYQNNYQQTCSFNVLYIGQCIIPYDTLSNASKLASIRSLIDYNTVRSSNEFPSLTDEQKLLFLKSFPSNPSMMSTSSSSSLSNPTMLVNLNIHQDLIRMTLLKTNDGFDYNHHGLNRSIDNNNTIYLSKMDIGFCGKIKNSNEFFALAILPNMLSNNNLNNTENYLSSASNCFLFRYLDTLNQFGSIEIMLNEISKIYRDKDSVFNIENENCINSFDFLVNLNASPNNKLSKNDHSFYSKYESYNSINNNSYTNMVSNLNYDYIQGNISLNENDAQSMEIADLIMKKSIKKENHSSNKKIKQNISNNSNHEDAMIVTYNTDSIKSRHSLNKHSSLDNQQKKQKQSTIANSDQQNTHTNGMKLIKENFTNLFLSKKSTSGSLSLGNTKVKNQQQTTSLSYNANRNKIIKNDDDEILKTIELETNKNMIKSPSTQSSPTLKTKSNNNAVDSSTTSVNINAVPTTVSSKFSFNSLNTRLSMKFSSTSSSSSSTTTTNSKLKKVSNQFQFLKSKPPIHSSSNENKINNKEFSKNNTKEEFFDAEHVLSSMESNESEEINQESKSLKNNQSSSRLSYPLISQGASQSAGKQSTNNKSITAKTNARKLLFNFITGGSQDDNNIGLLKSKASKTGHNHLINQQHRRLSDYHQPTSKVNKILKNL
jgi:hypothetical protein